MNIKSAFKKIETFASCHNCRASIRIEYDGSVSILLMRSDIQDRFVCITASLFFLSQRWWLIASLRGAVSRIFSSPGFSEKTETVLHDSNHAPQIEQEAPLWL